MMVHSKNIKITDKLYQEAEQNRFTAEELQAALSHCGNSNPIDWLRDNWPKLIDTVQTLATKYGQERKENIIGTISAAEARDALRTHKGNVWHSVTKCIEQRQRKFNDIVQRGNYAREDIVTALTTHQGNMDLALIDLGKTHMKPFLMRIWGPPAGADNDSANVMDPMEVRQQRSSEYNAIQEFISANADRDIVGVEPTNKSDETQSNPGILRDIETLIGNMEQTQAKQNEDMLKNIESLLGNILQAKQQQQSSRPQSQSSNFSSSYDRINVKSPIPVVKNGVQHHQDPESMENDVRQFVTQHIQDVVPDLVGHVEQGLISDVRPVHFDAHQDNEEILHINHFLEQELKGSDDEQVKTESTSQIKSEEAAELIDVPAATSVTELPQMSEVVIEYEEPPQILQNVVDITNYAISTAAEDVVEETVQVMIENPVEVIHPSDQIQAIVKIDDPVVEVQAAVDIAVSNENQSGQFERRESIKKTRKMKQKPRKNVRPKNKTLTRAVVENKKIVKQTSVINSIEPAQPDLTTDVPPSISTVEETIVISISVAPATVNGDQLPEEILVGNKSITARGEGASESQQTPLPMPTGTNAVISEVESSIALAVVPLSQDLNFNEIAEVISNEPVPSITAKADIPTNQLISTLETQNEQVVQNQTSINETLEERPTVHQLENAIVESAEANSTKSPTETNKGRQSRIPVRKSSSTNPPNLSQTVNQIEEAAEFFEPASTSTVVSNIDNQNLSRVPNLPDDTDIESIITETEFMGETSASERESFSDDSDETEHESELFAIASTSTTIAEPSVDVKIDKSQQNLSELVSDTQRLIKQMKDEINSDIASFISDDDDEYTDYDVSYSEDWSENDEEEAAFEEEAEEEYDDEEEEGEYEDEHAEAVADGAVDANDEDWTDTEGEYDSEYYAEVVDDDLKRPDEVTNDIPVDSDSIENETFLEAQEEATAEIVESEIVIGQQNDANVTERTTEIGVSSTTEQNIDNIQKSLNRTTDISMERRSSREINLSEVMAIPLSQLPAEVRAEIEQENTTIRLELAAVEQEVLPQTESESGQLSENVAETVEQELAEAIVSPQQKSELNQLLGNSEEIVDEILPTIVSLVNVIPSSSDSIGSVIETAEEISTSPSIIAVDTSVVSPLTLTKSQPVRDESGPSGSSTSSISRRTSPPKVSAQQKKSDPYLARRNSGGSSSAAATASVSALKKTITEEKTTKKIPVNNSEQIVEEMLQTIVNIENVIPLSNDANGSVTETAEEISTSFSIIAAVESLPVEHQSSFVTPPNLTKSQPARDESGPSSSSSKPSSSRRTSPPKVTTQRKNSDPNLARRNSGSSSSAAATAPVSALKKPIIEVKTTKKIPVRKASLPGPLFGSIRTSNVKQMQQELLNKSSKTVLDSNSKPSKIVPPKVYKPSVSSSLTERITKFIKPFTNGTTAAPKAGTSKSSTSAGKREIPKKKYHETCFSDDYQSSDDDDDDEVVTPSKCRQMPMRQQSMPNLMRSELDLEDESIEQRARRLLTEGKVANFVEAELAAELLGLKFSESSAIWAAAECSTLEHALGILQQECELCTGIYPMNRIVTMLKCTHSCCQDCAKNYFTIQVSHFTRKKLLNCFKS